MSIPIIYMQDTTINHLINEAKKVSQKAHAVYSNFPVGAAFTNNKGEVFTGCNVENISFGLTICAERSAIFKSISEGNHEISTLVIYTPTPKPTPPCGACRQVISEFSASTRIISVCDSEEIIDTTIDQLLPHSIFPTDLRK